MMQKIILATRNPHKVEEIAEILRALPVRLHSLLDFPEIPEIAETGATFAENARLKAREVFRRTGWITLSDDSGLEVDALNGAPGVYSARYAGPEKHPTANNARLLAALKGVPPEQRTAQFRCAVVIAFPGGEEVVEGIVRGKIADAPRGTGGFGYDPLFIPEGYTQTFAELGAEIKNRISHRARAFIAAKNELERLFGAP